MKRVRILTGLGQGGILDEEFYIRDDQYIEVERVSKKKKELKSWKGKSKQEILEDLDLGLEKMRKLHEISL